MNLELRKFHPGTDTAKPFDCADADLNGFLVETSPGLPNATFFTRELLAVTYVLEDKDSGNIVAYFSLLNDKVDKDFVNPSIWNRLSRKIPNAKRRSSYPALKIGRLAVSINMRGLGIGTKIINYIQTRYISKPSSGCRFVTVDAYRSAVDFYRKCDFDFLLRPEDDDETALMYFDLKSLLKKDADMG